VFNAGYNAGGDTGSIFDTELAILMIFRWKKKLIDIRTTTATVQ